MRGYLVVKHGPYSGKSTPFGPGDLIRFGRSGEAEVYLPDDGFLAPVHFAVAASATDLRLFLLCPDGVLVVNGKQVSAVALQHGDWIFAGITEWCVYLDAGGEKGLGGPSDRTAIDRIAADIESENGNLFAIMDAARDSRILPWIRSQSGLQAVSLYKGQAEILLADVAPHLVELSRERDGVRRTMLEFWGSSSVSFFVSRESLEEVRAHLRRWTFVRDLDGAQMYFRFYDPRILRAFLGSCDAAEAREFLGPLTSVCVEGDSPWQLHYFRADPATGVDGTEIAYRTEDYRVFSLLVQRVTEGTRVVPTA